MPVGGTDVLVVGAGLSGMQCARELASRGLSVIVLEARDRVGGRCHTMDWRGVPVDLGAHWVGATHGRVRSLAARASAVLRTQTTFGRVVFDLCDVRHETESATDYPAAFSPSMNEGIERLELLCNSLDPAAPWAHPRAHELDSISAARWAEEAIGNPWSRRCFEVMLAGVLSAAPSEVSMLFVVYFFATAGGWHAVMNVTEGSLQYSVQGGVGKLADRLASEVGERIRLNATVRALRQIPGGVVADTTAGEFFARCAVVSLPPHLAGRLGYEPPLPAARDHLTQRMPCGQVYKILCAFDGRPWIDRGLAGEAYSDVFPFAFAADIADSDCANGLLAGFVVGPDASRWQTLDATARRQAVESWLDRTLGVSASAITAIHEADWSAEAYTRGGYHCFMPVQTLSRFGETLRAISGGLVWAGTETSIEWFGHMEGALAAGERAAQDVLHCLRRDHD